ncbi:SIMPL domain-containing protein [Lentiprolixibacter aurantiacus]|uniref:SIMPL domain-containing protein n=1 Tax=Lentiprolixibacter aurantiacus TaxID=2993939 RepID=A0AAE3MK38_9FLAO|nr:SIMPL domain-containing protein [Lentiprolixibacter aurantiacus]MCX2718344.1 SIMPL domain-containing protein [Lentiprolixibacter aurantiacus]
MKNYGFATRLFLFLGTSFLLCLPAVAQQKNFIDQPYLETTTTVDTLVVPDRIYLNIVLTEADTKGRTSVEELENRMAAKLKSLGIDLDTQLSLSDLGSDFKKYFLRKTDIQKEKAYTLVVYDGLSVGQVLKGMETVGISNISLQKTEYSQMESLKMALRIKALLKAKQQGSSLVKAIGQQLGKALHIQYFERNFTDSRRGLQEMVVMTKSEPMDVEFSKIRIETQLSVKFAME